MAIQLIRPVLAISAAITAAIKDHAAPILVEKQGENFTKHGEKSCPSLQSCSVIHYTFSLKQFFKISFYLLKKYP
jgi:hypothetical protein